eukprot:TRINITY_DN5365_c0_g2_i2.p1 TRINITY_DN5365_c0_g2~~TRINITY_DN5365_c0_g2_i2.p1  ORF type:complete len:140 (+),score=7.85 TRINITY_DN5365_c0_g2_i2:82-501(+)
MGPVGLQSFPIELLVVILSFLQCKEIMQIRLVSSLFDGLICTDQYLWKYLYSRDWLQKKESSTDSSKIRWIDGKLARRYNNDMYFNRSEKIEKISSPIGLNWKSLYISTFTSFHPLQLLQKGRFKSTPIRSFDHPLQNL